MADRGAQSTPFTTQLTDFDDALIKRGICSREQCLLAKGMSEDQVLDTLVAEEVELQTRAAEDTLRASLLDRELHPEKVREEIAANATTKELDELEEDDELWRAYDGTAFDSALQVDPEHGVSPVKLIDMRFIIALGELGGTMVRRQDLPKEAFIDLDTLKRLQGRGALPIISISHPWQQPDHPDPKEVNLQLLAKVMKLMLEFVKQRDGNTTFAVFFE